MAHRTLIGGTAYNVSGGKSLVSGTSYNIKGGKTLVGGTGYNISFFQEPEATAMLYSDGDFVFQHGSEVASGKTLTASYTGFEDTVYTIQSSVPWNSNIGTIKNVSFINEIKPVSIARWFNNARNMTSFNWSNFNWNNVTNMAYAYRNCCNLTGSPVCGNNVTDMAYAYYNCKNLNAGTFYFYSKNVSNARNCFYGKNNSRRYNIHVPANSTTLNTFIINNRYSIVGKNITWTKSGTYYYNRTYNIYIYANTSMA